MPITLLDLLAVFIATLIMLVMLWDRVINAGLNSGGDTCLGSSENESVSKPYSKCGRCE